MDLETLLAMLRGGQQAPPDNGAQFYEDAGPEATQQLIGLGTQDERSALLQQQLAQADALRNKRGPAHMTLGGALGEGLGSLGANIMGGIQGMQARQGMRDVLDTKDAGRNTFTQQLIAQLRKDRRLADTAPDPYGDAPQTETWVNPNLTPY